MSTKIRQLKRNFNSEVSLKNENSALTPYEYNRGHVIHPKQSSLKYCTNVDWLELTTLGNIVPLDSLSQPETLDFAGGKVVLKTLGFGGNKHYQFQYNVFLDNDPQPFAVLFTSPRNTKVLNAEFSQIKLENHELYRKGWTERLTFLLGALNLAVNNLTRLDIAVDGGQVLQFMQAFENGVYSSSGKCTFTAYKNAHNKATGYDWGRKSSDKCLTIYDKIKELETSNKQYIRDNWLQNGMQLENGGQVVPIERCELKLRGKAIKRTMVINEETGEGEPIDFKRLEDSRYLAGIMKCHCKNWFEFTANDGDSNKSRDKRRFSPIDWSQIECIDMERLTTTKKPNEVWQAKRATAKLLKDIKTGSLSDAMHQALHECLDATLVGEQRDLISDEVHTRLIEIFKDLKQQIPIRLTYQMAKQHGIVDWLERKEQHIDKELDGVHKALTIKQMAYPTYDQKG